ncbi:ependymin-2-like [Sparus aurata]|uniref:Ependymin-2-like n=1 Tax=Sparus aurata TaxID=8175 RepID=A0A671U347_SPAAU|nr:ependymin-2-like [Sparus aurata]
MKVIVALACILACCLAQEPHPCKMPPLLTGALTISTQSEKLWAFANYEYDAFGRRLRLTEMGNYENKTFTVDYLLHYREAAMYEIDTKTRTCKKMPLKDDFQPWEIPKNSSLVGQAVVGSSSGPGQGLLVNTWIAFAPQGKYISTVTEFGCIPVTTLFHDKQLGWTMTSFFNNVIGITDPNRLNLPDFCQGAEIKTGSEEEPHSFLTLFHKKQ